ncbi:hypothetical protein SNEBB_008388 [Seison nebaliae]|nr:hypothetical protein SNEBB_008388 [Seison nebaliae]
MFFLFIFAFLVGASGYSVYQIRKISKSFETNNQKGFNNLRQNQMNKLKQLVNNRKQFTRPTIREQPVNSVTTKDTNRFVAAKQIGFDEIKELNIKKHFPLSQNRTMDNRFTNAAFPKYVPSNSDSIISKSLNKLASVILDQPPNINQNNSEDFDENTKEGYFRKLAAVDPWYARKKFQELIQHDNENFPNLDLDFIKRTFSQMANNIRGYIEQITNNHPPQQEDMEARVISYEPEKLKIVNDKLNLISPFNNNNNRYQNTMIEDTWTSYLGEMRKCRSLNLENRKEGMKKKRYRRRRRQRPTITMSFPNYHFKMKSPEKRSLVGTEDDDVDSFEVLTSDSDGVIGRTDGITFRTFNPIVTNPQIIPPPYNDTQSFKRIVFNNNLLSYHLPPKLPNAIGHQTTKKKWKKINDDDTITSFPIEIEFNGDSSNRQSDNQSENTSQFKYIDNDTEPLYKFVYNQITESVQQFKRNFDEQFNRCAKSDEKSYKHLIAQLQPIPQYNPINTSNSPRL